MNNVVLSSDKAFTLITHHFYASQVPLQTLMTLYPKMTKLKILSNQLESLIQSFSEKITKNYFNDLIVCFERRFIHVANKTRQ